MGQQQLAVPAAAVAGGSVVVVATPGEPRVLLYRRVSEQP